MELALESVRRALKHAQEKGAQEDEISRTARVAAPPPTPSEITSVSKPVKMPSTNRVVTVDDA